MTPTAPRGIPSRDDFASYLSGQRIGRRVLTRWFG